MPKQPAKSATAASTSGKQRSRSRSPGRTSAPTKRTSGSRSRSPSRGRQPGRPRNKTPPRQTKNATTIGRASDSPSPTSANQRPTRAAAAISRAHELLDAVTPNGEHNHTGTVPNGTSGAGKALRQSPRKNLIKTAIFDNITLTPSKNATTVSAQQSPAPVESKKKMTVAGVWNATKQNMYQLQNQVRKRIPNRKICLAFILIAAFILLGFYIYWNHSEAVVDYYTITKHQIGKAWKGEL